jgi:hypothetical protein
LESGKTKRDRPLLQAELAGGVLGSGRQWQDGYEITRGRQNFLSLGTEHWPLCKNVVTKVPIWYEYAAKRVPEKRFIVALKLRRKLLLGIVNMNSLSVIRTG